MFQVFRVQGQSMSPVLNDGDYVLASPWAIFLSGPLGLKVGSLVVVQHPQYQVIVKRLVKLDQDGRFLLSGENSASVSSKQMDWCNQSQVLGRVLLKIRQ